MKLDEQDYQNIADQITEGSNHIEYEKGELLLSIDCVYETEGSWEDDYYNGTGAYVVFERYLTIKSAVAYDEDGNEVDCVIDSHLLESLVY